MTASDKNTARFLVGIDLGTTHTVVAYADISKWLQQALPTLFEIDQLVAPGEVAKKPLLPSFRYHPAEGEVAEQDLLLPWSQAALPGELDKVIVGEWARELGSKVEGRSVVSAKSWLSHSQVDRSAAILPWDSDDDVSKVSPVLASASYLSHIRQAWNHEHPQDLLEHQELVITVPASFDEVARGLTVEAANMAGLHNILLLEEPQAACYDWYARNEKQAADILRDTGLLMVCDVGGGTTDLSLIRVVFNNGELALTRVGVGDHLMLGGDNVDLALAHRAEQRIVGGGKKLRAASLSQLIQQTRKTKELLLSEQAPEKAKVTVLGGGARLIGGAKSCELTRDEVRDIALDGFFPLVDFKEKPIKARGAIIEFGLPYVADPAVSKHIAEFIDRHAQVCRESLGYAEDSTQTAIPQAVLLNGGVFNSPLLSQRALSVFSQWAGQSVRSLHNSHPDLAVAYGAVAYAKARKGAQLKIGGGSARSYFLLLDAEAEEREESTERRGVCLLPKGTEEGKEVHLHNRRFALRLGQPVSFHLVSSVADTHYTEGDLELVGEDDFVVLPPLVAALDKELDKGQEVEVELVTTLTEVGTMQIECVSCADNKQRWNVEFQIRKNLAAQRQSSDAGLDPQLAGKLSLAKESLYSVFGQSKKQADPQAVKQLRNNLEKLLGRRDDWNTPLLRELFDQLLEGQKKRRRSEAHERVWFNLAGYCLRPGFGFPLDDWRVEKIWPLYQQGLQFPKQNQSWSAWWTFWRRVAGGLDQEQQLRIYKDISKYINPAAGRNAKLAADIKLKSFEDMVRLIASLEHLPIEHKIDVGNNLLKRVDKTGGTPASWWALGRVGARVPFHGSAHNVVPREEVHDWLIDIFYQDWKKNQNAAFAAVMLSRMSGDRTRDVDEEARTEILAKLKSAKAPCVWLEMVSDVRQLDEAETKRVFGEALPAGLKLIN